MTVADIKEKICNTMSRFEDLANRNKKVSANEVNLLLGKICSMLDELDRPKENTSQWTQHYKICGYVCDNCGHISEIKDDVCPNCKARMEDE